MNAYIRYFDQETLVSSFEELIDFLTAIPEITVTTNLMEDIKAYLESSMPYPKRYKVRPRVYFIVIKTTAKTMQEFKAYGESENANQENKSATQSNEEHQENKPGWYEVEMIFKRVTRIPETEKFQYVDTPFSAYINAQSQQECYDKMVEYIHNRKDVDARSQIPSIKSANFSCTYLATHLEFPNPTPPPTKEA